jgi:hypothetical protein
VFIGVALQQRIKKFPCGVHRCHKRDPGRNLLLYMSIKRAFCNPGSLSVVGLIKARFIIIYSDSSLKKKANNFISEHCSVKLELLGIDIDIVVLDFDIGQVIMPIKDFSEPVFTDVNIKHVLCHFKDSHSTCYRHLLLLKSIDKFCSSTGYV